MLGDLEWESVPSLALLAFRGLMAEESANEKRAESPWLSRLATWAQIRPGDMVRGVPNAANPLAATLVGGLAGAGLGYGAGTVAEWFLPDRWERGRLRRNLAMLGGSIGAMPGLGMAAINVAGGKGLLDQTFRAGYKYDPDHLPTRPVYRYGKPTEMPTPFKRSPVLDGFDDLSRQYEKYAADGFMTGIGDLAPVDVDEFNRVLWRDSRVAARLSPAMRAAASGLVVGADNLPGPRSRGLVWPSDIGRMAAGMGGGYLSGMLVGKALGALLGMPESTQEQLKNTGMWAGLVGAVVPKAFE